jgi:DUF3014 family protein
MDEDAKRWLYWAIPIVVVAGLGAALWYGRKHKEPAPEPTAQVEQAPVASAPAIKNPIEDEGAAAQPLPALADSDPAVKEGIAGVFGRSLDPYLVPQSIVRRFVVTVDNLPRKKTATQLWPLNPTAGSFVTEGADGSTLSADNFKRYAPIVKLLQSASTPQLVALYKHFYPLMQETYIGLGYPDGYFNDRVVEVIDHLLATPDVTGPVKLSQPSVLYQFADPSLEERSAGQKLLIRMGSTNSAAVKAKLREIRREIAKQDMGQQ